MTLAVKIKVIVFAIIAAILLMILYNTMVNRVGGDAREYQADFTSVSGLRPGNDVRAAGVRVGRVNDVELVDGKIARVTFVVGEGQQLTDTTLLKIKYQNLLGQKYLALEPGEQPGSVVPEKKIINEKLVDTKEGKGTTNAGFDLTALLNGFKPIFDTLKPAEVNKLATSIVAVLQGEAGTVETLLDETATLTQDLANKDELFGQVLDNLTPVLENMAANESEFVATIDELRALMKGLAAERKTIGDSIDAVSKLADASEDLLREARPHVVADIKSLRTLATLLNTHRDELDELFETMPLGVGAFSRPMNTGGFLNIYICSLRTTGLTFPSSAEVCQ